MTNLYTSRIYPEIMTNQEPERPNIRLADDDETPRQRHSRINRKLETLENRLEKLEHWKTYTLGLCTAFMFCGGFIGYLLKTYVIK